MTSFPFSFLFLTIGAAPRGEEGEGAAPGGAGEGRAQEVRGRGQWGGAQGHHTGVLRQVRKVCSPSWVIGPQTFIISHNTSKCIETLKVPLIAHPHDLSSWIVQLSPLQKLQNLLVFVNRPKTSLKLTFTAFYFFRWVNSEDSHWDIEHSVKLRDMQIQELELECSDMRGKFIIPKLKKVHSFKLKDEE